jgi:hypothetical protein
MKESALLRDNVDQPLVALANYCTQVLASDHHMKELVREADMEWGRRMHERPHFDRDGSPPHPDDPYTSDSVRVSLRDIVRKISGS